MTSPKVKEAYQKKTELRLKKLRSRISTLEKRIGKAEADIEVRYDQKMDQNRGQYAQTKDKLEELEKASQEIWIDQKNRGRSSNRCFKRSSRCYDSSYFSLVQRERNYFSIY